jgi:hypothetical protein
MRSTCGWDPASGQAFFRIFAVADDVTRVQSHHRGVEKLIDALQASAVQLITLILSSRWTEA